MYSEVQLTDHSRAPWQLQMVQKTYIDVVLTWYDMPFSIDNCQMTHQLSIPNRWWILLISSKMQLTGCSRRHDASEWFKWQTLTLPCLDMTSHSQLTIANSRASCLPLIDEGSFICFQRCSWRAVPGLWRENSKADFLPIFNRDTPCNYWPVGTGSRGRQACILFTHIK